MKYRFNEFGHANYKPKRLRVWPTILLQQIINRYESLEDSENHLIS